jgi:hypothetical protein
LIFEFIVWPRGEESQYSVEPGTCLGMIDSVEDLWVFTGWYSIVRKSLHSYLEGPLDQLLNKYSEENSCQLKSPGGGPHERQVDKWIGMYQTSTYSGAESRLKQGYKGVEVTQVGECAATSLRPTVPVGGHAPIE